MMVMVMIDDANGRRGGEIKQGSPTRSESPTITTILLPILVGQDGVVLSITVHLVHVVVGRSWKIFVTQKQKQKQKQKLYTKKLVAI